MRPWHVWANRFGPLIGLMVVVILFTILVGGQFLQPTNLELVARQTAIVGIAAMGMTLVIVSGGIDLSVGSIVALSTVIIALLLQAGLGPLPAACGGVMAGVLCGGVSGWLVTRFRVVPFIVTLGMMLVVRGVAKGLAGEKRIEAPITGLNELLQSLSADDRWLLFPAGVWILIAVALLVGGTLHYLRFGRHVIAVGSSELTARLCGIQVERVKMAVYAICAGCAGLAGVMQFARLSVGDPTVALGLELDVIAAVVIGGGSLAGGRGSVLGSLVGALIMTVIRIGSSQKGLDNWVQEMVTGGVIIVAVGLDYWRTRLTTSR